MASLFQYKNQRSCARLHVCRAHTEICFYAGGAVMAPSSTNIFQSLQCYFKWMIDKNQACFHLGFHGIFVKQMLGAASDQNIHFSVKTRAAQYVGALIRLLYLWIDNPPETSTTSNVFPTCAASAKTFVRRYPRNETLPGSSVSGGYKLCSVQRKQ